MRARAFTGEERGAYLGRQLEVEARVLGLYSGLARQVSLGEQTTEGSGLASLGGRCRLH